VFVFVAVDDHFPSIVSQALATLTLPFSPFPFPSTLHRLTTYPPQTATKLAPAQAHYQTPLADTP
jgi:hypothetical protein